MNEFNSKFYVGESATLTLLGNLEILYRITECLLDPNATPKQIRLRAVRKMDKDIMNEARKFEVED